MNDDVGSVFEIGIGLFIGTGADELCGGREAVKKVFHNNPHVLNKKK